MYKPEFSLLLFICCFFYSCTQDKNNSELTSSSSSLTLIATDTTELIDDASPLDGVIMAFHKLQNNDFILADNKPGIYLFKENELIRQYGNTGQGPCEYTEISASDVHNGSLYLLSSEQVKIIEYDIESGECIGEFSHKAMSGVTHLLKEDTENSFLILQGSFSGIQPDSTTLLYRLFENETAKPLKLDYGRVNAVPSVINFRSPNLIFAPYKDTYYFYLPQTDSVYNFTPATGTIRSFAHDLDLNRSEVERAGSDFQKMMQLMQEEVRMIGKVYSSPDWVALEYIFESMTEDAGQQTTLHFYDHSGNSVSSIPTTDLIGFQDGRFFQLIEDRDAGENPFKLIQLKPQFN